MKKIILSALLLSLLAIPGQLTRAIDEVVPPAAEGGTKTVALVSISGYDTVLGDVAALGQLIGTPGLDKQAEAVITLATGQGLVGLDKKRSWGVVVNSDGISFQTLAFVPVTDLKQLLGALAGLVGPPSDAGDDVFEIEKNDQKFYVKEQKGWAYIAQSADSLAALPADPLKQLGGLDKQYTIGIRLNVQNIPDMYRTMALDQLKAGMAAGMEAQEDEDDDDDATKLQRQMAQNQIKSLEMLFNDTDQLTIGWKLDRQAKTTFIDFNTTAIPGSQMAKQLASIRETTSEYTGFKANGAAFGMNFAQNIAETDIERASQMLDALKVSVEKEIDESEDLSDDNTKATAKQILAQIAASLKATVQSGKTDGGASLLLDEKAATVVAGAYIAKPGDLEDALKQLAQLAAKESNLPKIKFDADKHGSVRFHTFQVPLREEKLASVIGPNLDVAVGFGTTSVYLGLGTNCVKQLKTAIDESKKGTTKKIPPSSGDIALRPILEFASQIDGNPLIKAVAAELGKKPGKDHITFVLKPIKNGAGYRLEIQEGVLMALGALKNMAGGGAGGPPAAAFPAPGE